MSSFEGHYHSSVTADIAAGYSIQANDSEDDDLLSKTPTEHRKRSDILSEEEDLWQTPAEAFVQPSVGFLEKSKILKRQLYGEVSSPNHHSRSLSDADLNSSRVRSSSGNEPSTGYGSMSENCVTPTWSNRTLHRRSRCSVTPRPFEREFSSSFAAELFPELQCLTIRQATDNIDALLSFGTSLSGMARWKK